MLSKEQHIEFSTKWFDLLSKKIVGSESPYYVIKGSDCVLVVAREKKSGKFLLVRQFRPTIEQETIEFPAGHIDPGETPEEAVRRELLEETGFIAKEMIFLGRLAPDVGRLGNMLYCFATEGSCICVLNV